MPDKPQGQKRPGDMIDVDFTAAPIATGETRNGVPLLRNRERAPSVTLKMVNRLRDVTL